MTPPVGSTPASLPPLDSPAAGTPGETPARPALVHPQPLLNLRPNFANPIRSQRPINTLGDIRDAIVEDFIRGRLGESAQVVQMLGSFPGWLHPEQGLSEGRMVERNGRQVFRHWTPDEKPDLNVVGNGEEMLRRLAPMMRWDTATLEANIARVRGGMVYFNYALETPAGPLPVKMGIIDRDVLFRERTLFGGEPYFSLRASLLPSDRTYVFLDSDPAFQARFREWEHGNKADYLRRTLGTFLFGSHLTSEDIIRRSFNMQFRNYETYRVFDWFKGPKQAERLEAVLPHIFTTAIQQYLREHRDLKVYHMGRDLQPQAITPEIFPDLQFVLNRGIGTRIWQYLRSNFEFFIRNFRNARQTLRNIGSNGTRPRGYLDPNWLDYGLRKFGRFFGVSGELHTREYSPAASYFSSDAARGGETSTPVRQMVILAGYDKGGEEVPEVYQEIVRYAESELRKGANVNPFFRGIDPSKFTLPIRGIPSVAYQMMNWLRSDGVQHITVVGSPDTQIVYDRFIQFYADEITRRGKTNEFVLQGRNFTDGLKKGIATVPFQGEPVAVSFGDNPLIDMERISHHPHRWLSDWIVAANSRTRLTHDGGKNYHGDGLNEGVHDPSKEGNAYTYPSQMERVPWDFLQAIFDSRKSMADVGSKGKTRILLEILLWEPIRNTITLQWLRRGGNGRGTGPGVFTLLFDSLPAVGEFAGRYLSYQFQRRVLGRKVPAFAVPLRLSEHVLDKALGVRSSLFPNHGDPGGVLDIDGVFDLAIAKGLMEGTEHPERIYPHWEALAPFAQALEGDRDKLPALENTPERVNQLYERLRQSFLEKGFQAEQLRAKGFAADTPPMLPDGRMNPAFMELVLPQREFQFYQMGFEAYGRRVEHAKGLPADFLQRLHHTQPAETADLLDTRISDSIFRTLNSDPERTRAMLIEWNFDRINNALRDAVVRQFGRDSREVAELDRYLERSTTGNVDTPLRRIYTGFKAVDVLRRSVTYLSPEEFRSLYPQLQESIYQAEQAVPGGARRLRGYFSHAQTTADREFVRKVGESPPPYRMRGRIPLPILERLSKRPHSGGRDPVVRAGGGANGQGEVRRVDSAVILPQDIGELARRLRILPSRVPHLIAAAAHADTQERLTRIVQERLTPERLMAWAQTEEGIRFLENRGSVFADTFRNRLREAGPGLVVGLASLLGAEHLADVIGLDAAGHPQERFMFVVALGHVANTATASINEVLINRSLGQPFRYVTTRTVSAGGEAALQYTFEARTSMARAVLDSMTRNFGLSGGVGRIAWNGLKGGITLPFRAAWGMGPGLMASALVDRTFGSWFLSDSPKARQWLHFGSFFLPDLYRIGVGNRGYHLFENRFMRGASRAFAAGFIADMLFMGAQRLEYGSEGYGTQMGIYHRANQMHDAHRHWYSRPLDGAFEMIAPSLSAWWDSVEFDGLNLVPNRYQREAREELQRFSRSTTDQTQQLIRHSLIFGVKGQALDPDFYRRVDFGYLREPNILAGLRSPDGRALPVEQVLEQMSDPEINRRVMQGMDLDGQIAYIRRQFRGYQLSRTDVEAILDHIAVHRLRGDLAQFQSFQLPENQRLRGIFDGEGRLREGREGELVSFALGASVSNTQLLEQRRLALTVRILRLRNGGSQPELQSYESVARQVGLIDGAGRFTDAAIEAEARAQLGAAGSAPTVSAAGSPEFSNPRLATLFRPGLGRHWGR